MPDNFHEALDDSMHREERAVRALEGIADALTSWVKLEQARFEKEYPVKVSKDVTITKIPSDEDRLRESLGDTGEPLAEWLDIGDREREVIKKKKQ